MGLPTATCGRSCCCVAIPSSGANIGCRAIIPTTYTTTRSVVFTPSTITISISSTSSFSCRLLAPLIRVAFLVAFRTFDTRPIGWLGAVAASMTKFKAVMTLEFGHIPRLWALTSHVARAITVLALDNSLLVAFICPVAFFTTVTACLRLTIWAVACKVTHCGQSAYSSH